MRTSLELTYWVLQQRLNLIMEPFNVLSKFSQISLTTKEAHSKTMTKMSEMSDRMRENVAKQGFYMPLNPSHEVWGLLGPSLGSTCNKK